MTSWVNFIIDKWNKHLFWLSPTAESTLPFNWILLGLYKCGKALNSQKPTSFQLRERVIYKCICPIMQILLAVGEPNFYGLELLKCELIPIIFLQCKYQWWLCKTSKMPIIVTFERYSVWELSCFSVPLKLHEAGREGWSGTGACLLSPPDILWQCPWPYIGREETQECPIDPCQNPLHITSPPTHTHWIFLN